MTANAYLKQLNSRSSLKQYSAVAALGKLKLKSSTLDLLIQMLSSRRKLRVLASLILAKQGREAARKLIFALKTSKPSSRPLLLGTLLLMEDDIVDFIPDLLLLSINKRWMFNFMARALIIRLALSNGRVRAALRKTAGRNPGLSIIASDIQSEVKERINIDRGVEK